MAVSVRQRGKKVEVKVSFECLYCPKYQPAEGRRVGKCSVTGNKVAKTHSCNKNPNLGPVFLAMVGGA